MSNATTSQKPRTRMAASERRELIELAATKVFAKHGYHGASIDEIARRAGVSAPVVYDHFESKQDLHRRLLERHYAQMRGLWREQLAGDDPPERRVPRAIEAWFAYVETHPYAWKMLFADTTGDPKVQAMHRDIQVQSRAALLPLLAREQGAGGPAGEEALEMAWEAFRATLQGLAVWWYEHQHVPRAEVVATAMNAVWIGFERVLQGERWQP